MDTYQTEEEQIEAIKKWWKANGNAILLALVISVSVIFGWRAWQDHHQTQVETASVAFQNLLEASQKLMSVQGELSAELVEVKSVDSFANTVIEEHGDSQYAVHAHLLLAKKAVLLEAYDEAETHLKTVLRKKPESAVELMTRYRLAKVLLAKEAYEEANKVLSVSQTGSFSAAFTELKGDIALAQGQPEEAKVLYSQAMELGQSDDSGEGSSRPMLEMKYHDLAGDEE